jgi:hypothetical protein
MPGESRIVERGEQLYVGIGLRWAISASPAGDRLESRFESYLTDPAEEPDPQRWVTEAACLNAEA